MSTDQVLAAVAAGSTARDIARRLGTTNRVVVPILNRARAEGRVVRYTPDKTPLARWRLP